MILDILVFLTQNPAAIPSGTSSGIDEFGPVRRL
jgi:hypothetical protein